MSNVQCGQCKTPLNEPSDLPTEERPPCPECGSLSRHKLGTINSSIPFHSKVGYKAKRRGKGKPFIEGVAGDDLHRATGKWNRLERMIDRENDRYKEVIIDLETGRVVRHVEEPLSDHQGHGTAKKKQPPQ